VGTALAEVRGLRLQTATDGHGAFRFGEPYASHGRGPRVVNVATTLGGLDEQILESMTGGRLRQYFPWCETSTQNAIDAYVRGHIPHVYIELGKTCSLRCLYCDSPERREAPDALASEEIERALDELQELGLQFVFICGYGEPTSDPRFMPLLRSVRRRGLHVSFFSNLLPASANRAMLAELVDLKPNVLVKCDTTDTGVSDKLLGVKGATREILASLRFLCDNGFLELRGGYTNLGLSIVPTTYNIEQILDTVDFAVSIGAYPAIGELELKGRAGECGQALAVGSQRLLQLKDQIRARFGVLYERPLCQGIFCGLHVTETGDCVVDANSGLSCCWFLPNAEPTVLGNLRRDNVRGIWRSVIAQRHRQLDATVSQLEAIPAIIGLGGGGIPRQWAGTYRDATDRLVRLMSLL